MSTQNSGGIDGSSSIADIRDALSRQGASLETSEQDGQWTAAVGPGATRGAGASEDEAGYAAWRQFLANQGGTGAS